MNPNPKNPKNPKKYICEGCDFTTCNKKDYNIIVIAYFWEHDLEQSLDFFPGF